MEFIPCAELVKRFSKNEPEQITRIKIENRKYLIDEIKKFGEANFTNKDFCIKMVPYKLATDLLNGYPVNDQIQIDLKKYYLTIDNPLMKERILDEMRFYLHRKGFELSEITNVGNSEFTFIKIIDFEQAIKEINKQIELLDCV